MLIIEDDVTTDLDSYSVKEQRTFVIIARRIVHNPSIYRHQLQKNLRIHERNNDKATFKTNPKCNTRRTKSRYKSVRNIFKSPLTKKKFMLRISKTRYCVNASTLSIKYLKSNSLICKGNI